MKKTLLFCALFMAFALIAPSGSFAQTENIKVAVVDVQALMQKSKAAKSIQSKAKSLRAKLTKDVAAAEKKLQAQEEALVAEKEKGNQEAFKSKIQTFQKNIMKNQQRVQKDGVAIDKAIAKSLSTLRGNILEVVSDISEKEGYDLVLSSETIILADQSMNITDTVLKALDKKITSIPVKVSK